ncbi:MAG: YhjD/YihY/BrkB family envelope integrity protein [Limisphaerales bacterium]
MTGGDTGTEQEPNRLEHFAHFCVLVGKSFVRNRCPVRASALSFATLLALIPMLAVAISVTSSLLKKEGEDKIYGFIDHVVYSLVPPAARNATTNSPGRTTLTAAPAHAPATNELTIHSLAITNGLAETATDDNGRVAGAQKEAAKRIHEFIQKTQSGTLGVVGMLVLVFVAIRMLANIEETFNDIWGVTQGRSWPSRIVLYWATITLGPLLLAGALALAGSPHFQATKGAVGGMPVIGNLILLSLPLFVSWLVFALIYQLVPHTKIHFRAALVGGMVGGTLWQLNNIFGFLFVSRLMSNSKIYGSLFLLPVFMAGIYFSWLILLFGAQVAYAFQNRKAYLQDKLVENVNQRGREFIALRLMTCICQRFQNHLPPVTLPKISTELGIPTRLAQQVLRPLLGARLVVETRSNETAYTPARPLETITAHHILHAMRTGGGQELPMRDGPVRAEVLGEFARIEEAERAAASAITMQTLVIRASGKLEIPGPSNAEK